LAITTNASVGEVRDTRCTIASVGATDRAISNSPMASPRWVTGAYHVLPVDVSGQHPLSAGGLLLWAAVEGHHHRDVLVLPTATGHGTDRDVDQTHQGAAAHVRHQERHPRRAQNHPDAARHRLHSVDRGGLLHRELHIVEIRAAHVILGQAPVPVADIAGQGRPGLHPGHCRPVSPGGCQSTSSPTAGGTGDRSAEATLSHDGTRPPH
jgi:hypothetical protein